MTATRLCSVDGCDLPARTRGWCVKHYTRWRNHGDPLSVTRRPPEPGRPCAVDGCERPSHALGLCDPHYVKQHKRGSPDPLTLHGHALVERILLRVTEDDRGCWVWPGGTVNGYGRITDERGAVVRSYTTHRVVYEALVGPIPDGIELHHRCLNKRCVRPGHLWPMTKADHAAYHAHAA